MLNIQAGDQYLYMGLLVLLAAQVGCLFTKKVWVRLIPTLLTVALMVFCVVLYALSGRANWAFPILLFLLSCLLAAMGLVWLLYGLIRLVWKGIKNNGSCQ